MDIFPVEFRPEAFSDIEEIFEFLLETSGSFITAKRLVNRIFDCCKKIDNAPNGGANRDDLRKSIQLVPFERKVVILYKAEGDIIIIVNIIYGGRNYNALIISK